MSIRQHRRFVSVPTKQVPLTDVLTPPSAGSGPYADAESFPPQLKAFVQVSGRVKADGLLRRARWYYLLLGTGLLAAFAGCVGGALLLGESWFQLLIAAALGIISTQVAFIGHEAGHRQVLAGGRANTRLARILSGLVGLSFSWWDAKHSRHHGNPNKVGKDPDIAVDTISFIAADAAKARGPKRWITRRQGWLFFPLLTLEGLNLHLKSFVHLFTAPKSTRRGLELTLILVRFAVLVGAVLLLLPFGMAVAFLGVQVAVFGVYMGASFAPNHKGMPVIGPDTKLDFFTKQVRTSRNIRGGWWATLLFGGLNYQVEHHLFPSMARPHLAKARLIVREHCRTLGVPYTETSLWRSYAIVVQYLNRVGIAARDPFECPLLAQRGSA